jgi:hypothetical protein
VTQPGEVISVPAQGMPYLQGWAARRRQQAGGGAILEEQSGEPVQQLARLAQGGARNAAALSGGADSLLSWRTLSSPRRFIAKASQLLLGRRSVDDALGSFGGGARGELPAWLVARPACAAAAAAAVRGEGAAYDDAADGSESLAVGDLLVVVRVRLPASVTARQAAALDALLPPAGDRGGA